MKIFVGLVILFVIGAEAAKEKAIKVKDKDMMRKMIIYDKVSSYFIKLNEFHFNNDQFVIFRKLRICFTAPFPTNN
jgi:hypothetical protein